MDPTTMTPISKILIYLVASAFLGFVLAPLFILFLTKMGILRKSKGDKTSFIEGAEKIGTPLMGGALVVLIVFSLTAIFNWNREYTYLPMGLMIMAAIVGAIDDILSLFGGKRATPKSVRQILKLIRVHKHISKRIYYVLILPWSIYARLFYFIGSKSNKGLKVHEKIIIQVLIGVIVAVWVFYKLNYHVLWLPFGWSIDIGVLMIPFIISLVIVTMNAVNITDGMDGLGSGLLINNFTVLMIIAIFFTARGTREEAGVISLAYVCACVIGALLAYTFFNIKPARFEMGDVGTLGLGTLLAVVAILLHREVILIIAGGLFYIDGFLSVLLQIISYRIFGKRILKMAPLHYHFRLVGWSEEKIVMRFWIISLFLSFVGVLMATYDKIPFS
jgi:phospho-N-acetylmuramoyl-pentapeptide-transferase